MKIYYIGYYTREEDIELYKGYVPARLKMHYIARKLNELGYQVSFLSLNSIKDRKISFGKKISNHPNEIRYIASIRESSKVLKRLNSYLRNIQIVKFLLSLSKGDILIVYHSNAISKLVWRICNIRGIKTILQIEEIYGYSATGISKTLSEEIEAVKLYDYHMFVNDYIPMNLGIKSKASLVSYGVAQCCNLQGDLFDKNKKHVVYAGTIENRKMGALTSVRAAKYLSDNYVMHILGFGKSECIEKMKEEIREINAHAGYEKIVYHGQKFGSELDEFLCSCDIGISPNVLNEDFANHTFPSKVITYMSNGLKVVTGYCKSFEMCSLSDSWTYYYEFLPEAVALSVEAAAKKDISKQAIQSEVVRYDEAVCKGLSELINIVSDEI